METVICINEEPPQKVPGHRTRRTLRRRAWPWREGETVRPGVRRFREAERAGIPWGDLNFAMAPCQDLTGLLRIPFMKIRVELEYDPETNGWSAVCPELLGCASEGNSEQEALANIKEAIELYLEPVAEKSTPGAKSIILDV